MRVNSWSAAVVVLLSTMATSCAQWPGPQHRDVTLDGIQSLLETQCQPASVTDEDLFALGDRLDQQTRQLQTLNETLNAQQQELDSIRFDQTATECVLPTPEAVPVGADSKTILGAKEWIFLNPPGRHYAARVDTGASLSSISARNIQRFERDGKRWVSFELDTGDEDKEAIPLEAPLKRFVRIRQASYDDIDRRPVIELDVMLGHAIQQKTEFTLADRTRMDYPVLLGRSFLRDITLVDSGESYMHPKVTPDDLEFRP